MYNIYCDQYDMLTQKFNKFQSKMKNNITKQKLSIATLNYSGILTSPYQYHQDDESFIQKFYDKIFAQTVQAETKQDFAKSQVFQWNMGNIDVHWKTRFSPVNSIQCGIKQNNKMMTREQFENKWEQFRQKQAQNVLFPIYLKKYKEEQKSRQKMNEQIERAKIFDVSCYLALMKIIYGVSEFTDPDISCDRYIKSKTASFKKPYLCQKQKIQITLKMIINLGSDIFCIQQINKDLLQSLQKQLKCYLICRKQELQTADTIILLKKQTFPEIKSNSEILNLNNQFYKLFAEAQYGDSSQQKIQNAKNLFDWNNKTIFLNIGNLLIFSPHISSKKDQHFKQIQNMIEHISSLKNHFPNHHIICAGDFNGDIPNQTLNSKAEKEVKINIFPNGKELITSNKKRTLMQPQRHKGNKHDYSTKDFIISDCQIKNTKVIMANTQEINLLKQVPLLPNIKHPYDHFIVSGQIVLE